MLIFTEKDDSPLCESRPAVTMGVFDGVHRGHQAIIRQLREAATKISSPSMAITFSPHPRQALGRAAPPGICNLEKRLELLGDAGLDAVWVLPFTNAFAQLPGRDFAEEYFHSRLNAGAVILGEGAVFGHCREGSAQTLAAWAKPWHMLVESVPHLIVDGSVVSSTAIRLAIQKGELDRAADFLGRRFSVEGTVVHGQGHGAKLGFPTINLDPHHELRPPSGVYLTLANLDGSDRPSLTNIGRPPTEQEIEAGLTDFLIETHLLDFHEDVYGRTTEVSFIAKIRDVMRFTAITDLVRQVERDMEEARRWFAQNPVHCPEA